MALIKELRGKSPEFGENCYLSENATIIGDVKMGDKCSVWFNAVIRGDVNSIQMGNRVNVQDAAIIHCTFEKTKTVIGNDVSIGHSAIVHGCTIEDRVLIGMGAIVMDNAIVETGCIVAAGAVVLQGHHLKSGWVYAGTPAKAIKEIDENLMKGEIERIAGNYVKYADWYKS